jgi:hypothetical protein
MSKRPGVQLPQYFLDLGDGQQAAVTVDVARVEVAATCSVKGGQG